MSRSLKTGSATHILQMLLVSCCSGSFRIADSLGVIQYVVVIRFESRIFEHLYDHVHGMYVLVISTAISTVHNVICFAGQLTQRLSHIVARHSDQTPNLNTRPTSLVTHDDVGMDMTVKDMSPYSVLLRE